MYRNIQEIYRRLGDDKSKEIYANRLLFSLTGEREYMTRIIRNTELYQRINKMLQNDRKKKYIASAGQWGKIIADLFREFGFAGIIDNYVTGSYRGIPVMTLDKFVKDVTDGTVYIASTSYHAEFCRMLREAGVKEENIIDVTGMMLDVYHTQQYFDLPVLQEQKEEHEIFVDGGCYDAANSFMFAKWAGNAEKTIYAFEPDLDNIKKCRSVLEGMEDISYTLFPKGLWRGKDVLRFYANGNEGSRLAEGGDVYLSVTSVDKEVDGKVTFIKMDIEGAEYEALKGAENLICRHRPKLAISVYHKPEDIWELPRLILSFCPEYMFYLRHYSLSSEETVLYAVIEQKGDGKKE